MRLLLADVTAFNPNIQAEITLRYANGNGFVTGSNADPANTFYDGRIDQPIDITRHLFTGGSTQGGSRIAAGDLVLLNGDGALDDLINYGFDGRVLTIWGSEATDPVFPTDFARLVFTMDHAEFDNDTVTIKIRDRLQELTAPLQTNKYAGTNALPFGVEGVATELQGKNKPLCFGSVTNIAPPCVNTSKLLYQVNDGGVDQIPAVYDRGVALTLAGTYASITDLQDDAQAPGAGQYKVFLGGAYFRLGSSPDGQVTADVIQGGSAADRTAAQIFTQLLERRALANANAVGLGFFTLVTDTGDTLVTDTGDTLVATEDVSSADLTALDLANPAVLGLYVDDDMTITDACDMVANSVGAWWGVDLTGTFRIRQFTAPDPDTETTALVITANDSLKSLQVVATTDVGNGLPVYRSTVQYAQCYTVQTTDLAGGVTDARRAVVAQQWRTAVAVDPSTQIGNLLAVETVETSLLTTATDAQAEANRRLELRRIQRFRFEVVLALTPETGVVELGDMVEIRHKRYGLTVTSGDTVEQSTGTFCRVLDIAMNARDNEITLTVWGVPEIQNLITDDGFLLVTDDGFYLTTSG